MNTSGVSFESLMEEKLLQEEYADVVPSVNPGANEVYTYLFEAEQAYLEIMKALALQELKQTAFSQTPYMHEAETTLTAAKPKEDKGFLAKAIDAVVGFIKKIWNGIVSVWKWFVAKFDEYIRFNNSFVSKYSKELAGIDSTEFEGYEFPKLNECLAKAEASHYDLTVLNSKNFTKDNLDPAKKLFLKVLGLPDTNFDPKPEDMKKIFYGESKKQKFTIKDQIAVISNIANDKTKVNKTLKKFEEGDYESLAITLGQGSGDNWWCVLFPPLCLLEASSEELDDVTYSFYIKDIINKF